MNPYNFTLLFFSFCTFLIGLLIWLKRPDPVGRVYFFFSLFAAIWGAFFSIMLSQSVSYDTALFCARLAQAGAVFVPITWFHFTLRFTGGIEPWKRLLKGFYVLGIVIDSFAFTRWFVPILKPASGFIYYLHPAFFFHIYTGLYFVLIPLGCFRLAKKISTSGELEKFQLRGLFIATFFGFFAGGVCFLPVYGIMIPQYNLFLMPIYPFVMAYFMIRHRLFDVEQVVQVFQREKLATIGLLAASVNHEIRNPLYIAKSALESYIEGAEEGLGKAEPLAVSKKSLAAIHRALEVITKLNRFAKPTSETNTSNSQASVQEAIKNILDLISYEFELDKIHIKNQVDSNTPAIQADQRQLEEILFNLIVNACHAMKEGQETGDKRQGGMLEIKSTCHSSHVTIEIKDSGTGISPEQAKHLFEPFHTTKGDKGTGLGLYITKQLVERNEGKIMVESKEGQGTIFRLEFKAS